MSLLVDAFLGFRIDKAEAFGVIEPFTLPCILISLCCKQLHHWSIIQFTRTETSKSELDDTPVMELFAAEGYEYARQGQVVQQRQSQGRHR